jgi:uncharacterized membrane protein HdeD (DUF308 family)
MRINDEPASPWIGRAFGIILVLAGIAAAYAITDTLLRPPPRDTPAWVRMVFYGLLVPVCAVALIEGTRLALAPSHSEVRLSRVGLAIGAGLMLVVGVATVVLALIEPKAGSVEVGITLGIGGALAAFRLLRKRSRPQGNPNDA